MTALHPDQDRQPARGQGSQLSAEGLVLSYGWKPVVDGVSIDIPPGRISAVIGANGCGKSTLLKGLARLLVPEQGVVRLDGEDLHDLPTREVARRIGVLPQSAAAPVGITAADLVARGRSPHQRWWQQWSRDDETAVAEALSATGLESLAASPVEELSGGQRQRVWIAMTLAQQTDILLLDEPTTYLDLAHQVEVLDLVTSLNTQGRTVMMVLHDLNQAARYAHHIFAMKAGQVVAAGRPADVITADLVQEVFGLRAQVTPCPVTGRPLVIPN